MKVTYNEKDKVLSFEITEEIDHHSSERIRTRADFEIQKHMPKKIVMNFEKVNFMDSAGIGLILGRYKTITMFGGSMNIENVKPNVKRVLEMAGITKIIPITNKIGGKEIGKCV